MKNKATMIPKPILSLFVLALALTGAAAETLHKGGWDKQEYKISGGWEIVREGGKTHFKLDEKFKTRSGPDLKIFLTPHPVGTVKGSNATDGAKLVALLKKNKGASSYEIPPGVDLAKYKTVVIHCEKFSKLWGAAKL